VLLAGLGETSGGAARPVAGENDVVLLLLIILLIAAAAAGVLWQVVEIAAGVALGLFLFVALLAVVGYLMIRYRIRKFRREWYGARDRRRQMPY
jgi:hypothetical protein